jgi:hypothetical protein
MKGLFDVNLIFGFSVNMEFNPKVKNPEGMTHL